MRQLTSKTYKNITGTINDGQSNVSLSLNAMYNNILIINKTTGKTLNVKLNETTNDNIGVDTTYNNPLSITNMDIYQVYLSNSSGVTITYQILLTGV